MASLTGLTFCHKYSPITSTEALPPENAQSEWCWVGCADITQREFTAALSVLSGGFPAVMVSLSGNNSMPIIDPY